MNIYPAWTGTINKSVYPDWIGAIAGAVSTFITYVDGIIYYRLR